MHDETLVDRIITIKKTLVPEITYCNNFPASIRAFKFEISSFDAKAGLINFFRNMKLLKLFPQK